MPNHTLHPSHSLLTEDRVFIPRTCSTCLAEEFAKATALPVCAWPRSLVSPFWIMCEKGRNEAARVVTEGRYWRRAPEEAPKTVRRENMANFGFWIFSRNSINWRLCLKPSRIKSKRYRDAGPFDVLAPKVLCDRKCWPEVLYCRSAEKFPSADW
jgi:hypothetical protein